MKQFLCGSLQGEPVQIAHEYSRGVPTGPGARPNEKNRNSEELVRLTAVCHSSLGVRTNTSHRVRGLPIVENWSLYVVGTQLSHLINKRWFEVKSV